MESLAPVGEYGEPEAGAFEDARFMRTWKLHWDWLEGYSECRVYSPASMLLQRCGMNVAFAGVESLSALPIETPPRKRPKISEGGFHLVAIVNSLSESSIKSLILRYYYWI